MAASNPWLNGSRPRKARRGGRTNDIARLFFVPASVRSIPCRAVGPCVCEPDGDAVHIPGQSYVSAGESGGQGGFAHRLTRQGGYLPAAVPRHVKRQGTDRFGSGDYLSLGRDRAAASQYSVM